MSMSDAQPGDALQALVERGLERLRAVPTLAPLLADPAQAALLRQVVAASAFLAGR